MIYCPTPATRRRLWRIVSHHVSLDLHLCCSCRCCCFISCQMCHEHPSILFFQNVDLLASCSSASIVSVLHTSAGTGSPFSAQLLDRYISTITVATTTSFHYTTVLPMRANQKPRKRMKSLFQWKNPKPTTGKTSVASTVSPVGHSDIGNRHCTVRSQ